MKKIGILSSHNGSGFISLNEACKNKILNAQIAVVISNNSDANVLKYADENKIDNYVINSKLYPNDNVDLKILEVLKEHNCDYVFLSGYMKKIDKCLTDFYENKMINSHPALLPNFGGKGMYGRNVHEAVVQSKVNKTGVTIHYVNENYDEGEYILQNEIEVFPTESVDSVENRVKNLESQTIIEAFKKLIK